MKLSSSMNYPLPITDGTPTAKWLMANPWSMANGKWSMTTEGSF
jgi:hypothetical protein